MESSESSTSNRRRFATLDEALASLGIDAGSDLHDLRVIRDGVFETDASSFDLRYGLQSRETELTELCDHCKSITAATLTSPQGHLHAASFEDLFDAARQQCGLCANMGETFRMLSSAEREELAKPGHPIKLKLIQPKEHKALAGSALAFQAGDFEVPGVQSMFYVRCLEGDPAEKLGVSAIRKLNCTSSSDSAATTKAWFDECCKAHDCSSEFSLVNGIRKDLPSRLLYISSKQPGECLRVKVVKTSSTAKYHYATLSHCWGSNPDKSHTLTKSNETERAKYASVETLPKTFREAVKICSWLALRYLWIDSLCIIQDSKDDWVQESKKMGGIYANSAITIAADASQDSSGGCFNEKSKWQLDDCESVMTLTNKLPNNQESTLFIYPYTFGYGTTIPAIDSSTLSKRAWTFQARLLPPRILHCTSTQLYWECRAGYRAEDGMVHWQPERTRTLPSFVSNPETAGRRAPPYDRMPPASRPDLRRTLVMRQLLDLWYTEIVPKHYSGRQLTYATDKLVAISGVARAIGGMWDAQYFCGLWSWGLAEALVYLRSVGVEATERPADGVRFPSWSWASVDFPVMWPRGVCQRNTTKMMHLEAVNIRSVPGGDLYSPISFAMLRIRTLTAKLRLQRHEPDQYGFKVPMWLMDDEDNPVGFCTMDYDEPEIHHVLFMLSYVASDGQLSSYSGHGLLLVQVELGGFVRVGAGMAGVQAPGTYQMEGVRKAAEMWLYNLITKPEVRTISLY